MPQSAPSFALLTVGQAASGLNSSRLSMPHAESPHIPEADRISSDAPD